MGGEPRATLRAGLYLGCIGRISKNLQSPMRAGLARLWRWNAPPRFLPDEPYGFSAIRHVDSKAPPFQKSKGWATRKFKCEGNKGGSL
jgi:hypothetical protein